MANDRVRFTQLLAQLEDAFDVLTDTMVLAPVGYYAQLPDIYEDDVERYRRGELTLQLGHLTGEAAVRAGVSALRRYQRHDDDVSGKYSGKYPGVLFLENPDDVMETIAVINQLKDDIAACVQDRRLMRRGNKLVAVHQRNHLQKHEFLHAHGEGYIAYQLYRQIDVVNAGADDEMSRLRSVNFHWISKNADKYLDVETAVPFIMAAPPNKLPLSDKVRLRDILHERVNTHRFCVRKTRNDTVNASLYFGTNGTSQPVTTSINASQPILLTNYGRPEKVTVHPLKPHDPTRRRDNRTGSQWECLDDELSLYCRPMTEAERDSLHADR